MVVAVGFGRALAIAGSRWLHLLAGVTWIGLLYYFNFVQTPSFAEFEAASRTDAIRRLVPRALWWFRWGAALTFLSGLMILGFQDQMKGDYFKTLPGMTIFAGALMATVMFLNVWLVIWPNQRTVIANAEGLAAGREADPAAAPAGRRASLASRTNTLFSIPVLFFMIATSHFVAITDHFDIVPGGGKRALWYILVLAITAIIELNALGVIGGTGPGPTKKPLETHRDTIIAGFVLWAIYFVLILIIFS